MIDELRMIAASLLTPLWRGLDADYKRRYAVKIWQQFESNIRSAAYTNSVARFVEHMTRRLPISINERDIASLIQTAADGDDRRILRALREHTALLVLLVRDANNERKSTASRSLLDIVMEENL